MQQLLRLLCVSALFVGTLFAHEVLTHQNIGNVAVAYLQQNAATRPLLPNLQQLLLIGAVQEDQDPLPGAAFPLGRYFFHFNPNLNLNLLNLITLNGTCNSMEWGLEDAQCIATCHFPGVCFTSSAPQGNNYRWNQDLTADNTGVPTLASIKSFGYVVHLLEDLGSPPHTRNDMHPCGGGLIYCDPYEIENNSRTPSMPTGAATIPTSGFTTPEQFFQALQAYVSSNYYSNNTAFALGMPGPADALVPDDRYFYGACIPGVSNVAGTCQSINGQPVRKIAHKGPLYWAFLSMGINDPTKAGIDSVIAQEQFDELGPVIAQHVAAFIRFYAPAVTVTVQGSGTVTSSPGTGINCSSGTCSALFVQGMHVTLTASPTAGSSVTWGGGCASGGTSTAVQLTVTNDVACTVTFAPADGTITGTITSASCSNDLLSITGTATGSPDTFVFAGGIWIAAQDPNLNGLETGVTLTCTPPWSSSCQAPSSGTTSTTFTGANLKGPGTIQ